MSPAHRYMVAFMAASLKARRTFTHVHDHDAGREIAVGGAVRADGIDIVEGLNHARFSGKPEAVLDHAAGAHIQLGLENYGFSGYDYASEKHFHGMFAQAGAVQLFDHDTGRWHAFHIS